MPAPTAAPPPIIDEGAALWAAATTARTSRSDPAAARSLRDEVAADMPRIDAAARDYSRLGGDLPETHAQVVGRLGWVRTNLSALRGAFEPLRDRVERGPGATRRVLGVQLGAVLGLLSTKVLGQYVLPLGAAGGGRLLVVGPNVLELTEEHGHLAVDVRRTVLLHEVTHRLQFDGVPWLGDHLRTLIGRYLAAARLDAAAVAELAPRLPSAIAAARAAGDVEPLLRTVLTPEQLEVVDEAQGLMSLLEGHGNAVMDLGSGELVDDPEAVRGVLASRHGDITSKVLNGVAGLEMKRRQYREGEAFVRAVVTAGGVGALNRAFASPENLPSVLEVADPSGWLARVS